jgi:hypothetical protein
MENFVDSAKYKKGRKGIEKYFKKGKQNPHGDPIVSPSGNFVLNISSVETRKGCWNYTRGMIMDKNVNLIADIKRNYCSFPYLWVLHPNGNEYLVCGEDYQGYTIINVSKGTVQTFIPEGWLNGVGFCWVDHKFDPETQHIVVEGCFWACPYERVTYNFSNPDVLPLPELKREDVEEENTEGDDEDE